MTTPKLSPKPWTFDDNTKSVVDATGRPVCGFFDAEDDGRWVAAIRTRADEVFQESKRLAQANEDLERKAQAMAACIKALKEELAQAKWWVDRYFAERLKP